MYVPGKSKEYIRNNVFLYFMNCNKILTLPNVYFNLEKQFIKYGKEVECIERDEDIYNQQLIIKPDNIKLYHQSLINTEISNYNGLFLDMCGPFTMNLSKILNKLNTNTRVVITLLMARESKWLQQWIDINNREESYINLLNLHHIKVTKYINYRDSQPMCVFFGIKI